MIRALILAAGYGTRLRPLTWLRAKPAVPFLNRPLIQYSLELLAPLEVEEIVINLHHLPESVREAVPATPYPVHFSWEETILGTAGALRKVRDRLAGGPFLLCNGKIYFEQDLQEVVDFHRARGSMATLVLVPYQEGFNPVYLDEEQNVVGFGTPGAAGREAVPAEPKGLQEGSRYVFTGVQVLEPEVLEFIPEGFSDLVRHVYPRLIRQGLPVRGFVSQSYWCECSTPARYLEKSLEVLKRKKLDNLFSNPVGAQCRGVIAGPGVSASASVSLQNSILWGDLEVGPNSSLHDVIITRGIGRLPAETHLRSVILTPPLPGSGAGSQGFWDRDRFWIWPL